MRHIGSVLGLLALATAPAFTNPEMTEELPGGATMDFIWIDPGTFTMGSPSSEPGRYSAEGPQHEVTISRGFWLGKYEVTQRQWETVMGTTPWSGQAYVQPNPDHPAVYISSADVQGLVQALDLASGDSLYRLPTEAEWEYACRAGTTTRWSFGDDERQVGEHAWYLDNAWDAGLRYAQPVGTKLPNPWGLHDMHGNVWEWVQDYGSYSGDSQVDPQGAVTGATRVVRSATFDSAARDTRSAYRLSVSSDERFGGIGARLLKMGPPPTSVTPQSWGALKAPGQP
jgi:formylglycine-generating enzyme required for sulfatase activity